MNEQATTPIGIRVLPGTQLVIPAGGLKIEKGSGETTICMKLRYDVAAHWLHISLMKTRCALQAEKAYLESGKTEIQHLVDEFNESIIVVVAVATFFDAIYAQCKSKSQSGVSSIQSKSKRPKRSASVAEEIKKTFKINQSTFGILRSFLIELYDLRDRAVHPGHKLMDPVIDGRVDQGVHPIFICFNARAAVCYTQRMISVLEILMEQSDSVSEPVIEWKKYMRERYIEILRPYVSITSVP